MPSLENLQEKTCANPKTYNFIKKETLAMFTSYPRGFRSVSQNYIRDMNTLSLLHSLKALNFILRFDGKYNHLEKIQEKLQQ